MLHPSTRVRPSSRQVSCPVGDELAILDLQSGTYFGLDPVGSYVWARLPRRVDELVDDVVAEFDVDRETASRDLLALFAELARAGLVDVDG
jgi:hypothetical protein